jgi:hypothetical protein
MEQRDQRSTGVLVPTGPIEVDEIAVRRIPALAPIRDARRRRQRGKNCLQMAAWQPPGGFVWRKWDQSNISA